MARTKYTVRLSTGDKGPRRMLPKPQRQNWAAPPRTRGKWAAGNLRPARKDYGAAAADLRVLRLPPNSISLASSYERRNTYVALQPVRDPQSKICLFTTLPEELLLQIFGYFVPRGMTFHIFPSAKGRRGQRPGFGTVIHAFGEPVSGSWLQDPRRNLRDPTATALASVCRRFSETYHDLMYGRNGWIFEMAMGAITPVALGSRRGDLQSWSRIFDVPPLGIWPLTSRSATFVKTLTVLVTLEAEDDWHEGYCLAGQLERSLALFSKSTGGTALRDLTVQICGSSAWTIHAAVDPRNYCRLEWVTKGDTGSQNLRLWDHYFVDDPCENAEPLWETLKCLHGVGEVALGGLISEGRAKQLVATSKADAAAA